MNFSVSFDKFSTLQFAFKQINQQIIFNDSSENGWNSQKVLAYI